MEVFAVSIRGVRPLLQHRFGSEEEAGLSRREKKIPTAEEEAKAGLYLTEKGEVYQPALHIEGAMIRAAKSFAWKGKKMMTDLVKAGVFVEPLQVLHKNPKWVVDVQRVKIRATGGSVRRARPRLDNWELEFTLKVTDERVREAVLKEILQEAGRSSGIGDYRPRFGLFNVTRFERVE